MEGKEPTTTLYDDNGNVTVELYGKFDVETLAKKLISSKQDIG